MSETNIDDSKHSNGELGSQIDKPLFVELVRVPAKIRDRIDRALVFGQLVVTVVQLITLIFVIIYVRKTSDIASSTRDTETIVANAAKAQVAVTLEEKLHSDRDTQEMLTRIFDRDLQFKEENGEPIITSIKDQKRTNIERELDITLNRFEILGHLQDLRILDKKDLAGLEYEIIEIGRNKAIRDYFDFLNHQYQQSSGVNHDHFKFLKQLYLAFEYDSHQAQEFQKYLCKQGNACYEP